MKKKLVLVGGLLTIALALLIGVLVTKNKSYAANVSSNFKIMDAQFCSDANCTTIYNENDGVPGASRFVIKVNWKYESSTPIKNGDTIIVPFANNVRTDTTSSFDGTVGETDMYDNNGELIGNWRVTGTVQDKRLRVTFNENADGRTFIVGTFTTGKSFQSKVSYRDIVIPITLGDISKNIRILPSELSHKSYNSLTGADNITNDAVTFMSVLSNKLSEKLFQYDTITSITDLEKEYLEDIVCETYIPNNVIRYTFTPSVSMDLITDAESHTIGTISVQSSSTSTDFTEVNANNNESCEDFKSRLTKYQYGACVDNGQTILVVKFGNQPSEDLTYLDYFKKEPGDYLRSSNPFTYSEEVKEFYNRALGSNNLLGGKIAHYASAVRYFFNSVTRETPVTYTSTCSYTENGSPVIRQFTRTENLRPASSTATVKGQARLELFDKTSNEALKDVSITLQKKNGNNWGNVGTAKTTDANGVVLFNGLENGEYRYVQNNYLDNYINGSYKLYSNGSATNQITSFNLTEEGNVSYATNEREKYTVTYLPGSYGDWNQNDYIYNIYYGDPAIVPEDFKGRDGWVFNGWTPTFEGIVTKNTTYTATWKKPVKVTVHHYAEGTTTKVAPDVIIDKFNGDTYVTNALATMPEGFISVIEPENKNGTVGTSDIEVTYYYKYKDYVYTINHIDIDNPNTPFKVETGKGHLKDKILSEGKELNLPKYDFKRVDKDSITLGETPQEINIYYEKKKSTVVVKYVDKDTEEEIGERETLEGKIDSEYETTKKEIRGYEYVEDTENTKGIYTLEPTEVIYYYKLKEYTYKINYVDKETKEIIESETGKAHLGDKVEATKKDIPTYEFESFEEKEIEINEETKEINVYYTKKKNTLVVRYVDENGKDITDYIETTDKIGTAYQTEKKALKGYTFVKSSDNTTGEYGSEAVEVIYYYKKAEYKIETEVVNGEIDKGYEIEYGETAKVKYTPKEGYKLKSVIIDGNSVDISKYPNEYEFTDVEKNHTIKVEYEKKSEIDVPKTLDDIFTYVFMFGGSILFIVLIALGIKKTKNIKKSDE